MRVLLVTHPASLEHPTPVGHPERPSRIAAVVAGVHEAGHEAVAADAPLASRDDLLLIHDEGYVDQIEAFCAAGRGALDPDTYAGPESWPAALRSAGAAPAAVAALAAGAADTAFVAMRPPGHHAERARAMGFCLFNNVAIAAAAIVDRGERVAIVDWDVHHGNGTQNTFYAEPSVLYVSVHESPLYPGTGHLHELGAGMGRGTTINLPLPTGSTGADYGEAFRRVVGPVLRQFSPDWVLVSCGYDAHRADPLAGMSLIAADYGAMAATVAAVAGAARTVFVLEGGYDLDALRSSAAATVRGALGASFDDGLAGTPTGAAVTIVDQSVARLGDHWALGREP